MKKIIIFLVIIVAFILSITNIIIENKKTNIEKTDEYINQIINRNFYYKPKRFNNPFERKAQEDSRIWAYTSGTFLYGLYNTKKYDDIIKKFYDENLLFSGELTDLINKDNNYREYEVDSIPPARVLLYLIKDKKNLSKIELVKYKKGIDFVFEQLQKQPRLKNCGNNFQHKVNNKAWLKYEFALDGIYMALPFYLEYTHNYKDVFNRMNWTSQHLKLQNGLYSHGINSDGKTVNNVVWLRGVGWYAMAQVDLLEMFPEGQEKETMTKQLIQFFDPLLEVQDKETGMWLNVIYPDKDIKCNQLESSGSLMMAYALLKAYNKGFVSDKKYLEAGLNAFNGTVSKSLHKNVLGQYHLDDIYLAAIVEDIPENYCACDRFVQDDLKGIAPLILANQQVKLLKENSNLN